MCHDQLVAQVAAPKEARLGGQLGNIAAVLAVAAACALSWKEGMAVTPKLPILLAIASATLWFHWPGRSGGVLQHVIGAYLCCIPVNEISGTSVEFRAFGLDISFSWGLLLLGVIGIGAVAVGFLTGRAKPRTRLLGGLGMGWVAALSILAVHMAVLAALLGVVYGYGYEKSPSSLGRASLYCCLYAFLGSPLRSSPWRRVLSATLTAYYSAITAGLGGAP